MMKVEITRNGNVVSIKTENFSDIARRLNVIGLEKTHADFYAWGQYQNVPREWHPEEAVFTPGGCDGFKRFMLDIIDPAHNDGEQAKRAAMSIMEKLDVWVSEFEDAATKYHVVAEYSCQEA